MKDRRPTINNLEDFKIALQLQLMQSKDKIQISTDEVIVHGGNFTCPYKIKDMIVHFEKHEDYEICQKLKDYKI